MSEFPRGDRYVLENRHHCMYVCMFIPDRKEEAVQLNASDFGRDCQRLSDRYRGTVYSPSASNDRTVNNGLLFYLHDEALNYKHH